VPRKKRDAITVPAEDAGQETDSKPTIFDKATVDVLPDGRVRATIKGIKEEFDELTYKVSQSKTAKFILNDIAPEIK
jgi:hypothetical protein